MLHAGVGGGADATGHATLRAARTTLRAKEQLNFILKVDDLS